QIDHRSPQFPDGDDDPAFTEARSAYFGELDAMIARMQQDRAAGLPLRSFPPLTRAYNRQPASGNPTACNTEPVLAS
ncbi:MAG: hypothetical protein ACK5OR_05355, partial [Betaproteobacteria bacterium]